MSSRSERLDRLARLVDGTVVGDGTVTVEDATHDSREARAGTLFVAIRGFSTDGHRFVPNAVAAGASAVVVEEPLDVSVPQLVVDDARASLGRLASAIHGSPSTRTAVVGVTGTNGKTSVTRMLGAIIDASGAISGVVGTLGAWMGGSRIPLERTTPEAGDFQRLLAMMADGGATAVAVEVSSHALELGRVDGTVFEVAAFTNLSQDHLDFHGDMESYFASKATLFQPGRSKRAVVWIDDPWGERLAGGLDIPVLTVGIEADAHLRPRLLAESFSGSRFALSLPGGEELEIDLPIAGRFSVANAAVAIGCAEGLGLGSTAMTEGLAGLEQIPGRFELVSGDSPVSVVVDYSHTPAGIEAAILTARSLTSGRVIAVLGAGGDRDQGKRPLMGVAASAADLVVVTSDNPRSERPAAIIDDIVRGVTGPHETIESREAAINRALDLARSGDAVLIMGKGHEAYQEVAGELIPFDDGQVARAALARVGGDGA